MSPARANLRASRTSCAATIALVFFAGAVAGAIARDYARSYSRTAPFYTEAGKEISLRKWRRELNLSAQQTQEIERILDDFGMYYRNVVGEGKARILKILDESQRKKFDQLLGTAQK